MILAVDLKLPIDFSSLLKITNVGPKLTKVSKVYL